ncbi:NAD(P)-dependent oxidoreductase [Amylibacter sp.]|nr:NAD(P)-dependent oxidoreductase [Amylibacter sp.]
MGNNNKKKVIVTGATGFIGQNLIPYLIEKGYEITAISRNPQKAVDFDWFSKVDFIQKDISQHHEEVEIGENTGLFHLAWEGLPHYNSAHHYEENLPNNYNFVKKMIQSGIGQVLVTGTCFEYGFQSGPISSNTKTNPSNSYAIAKDNLHQHLKLFNEGTPFVFQWARLFYMYGNGQNPTSVIAQLDHAINNNETQFNMSEGEQLRDYLPITEVVEQLHKLFENSPAGTYNVCSGQPISIRSLVEARKLEKQSEINLNLGYFSYPDYEPMAFWGIKDIN